MSTLFNIFETWRLPRTNRESMVKSDLNRQNIKHTKLKIQNTINSFVSDPFVRYIHQKDKNFKLSYK